MLAETTGTGNLDPVVAMRQSRVMHNPRLRVAIPISPSGIDPDEQAAAVLQSYESCVAPPRHGTLQATASP